MPFVTATIFYGDASVEVPDMLIDTGSASTLINADIAAAAGIIPEPTDLIRVLRGVGGREVVFARQVARLEVGTTGIDDFEVEVGGMDYGFPIGGILGMDFLRQTGAILNLQELSLTHAE